MLSRIVAPKRKDSCSDHADMAAQAAQRHLTYIHPIHQHTPAGWIIKTRSNAIQSRFACPVGPTKCHRLTGFHREVNVVKHTAGPS
jgi:hypothetical protein